MVVRGFFSLASALILSACQHHAGPVPAVLADADTATVEALKSSLATAMDRAQIELGAGDPTQVPSVVVLPPKPSTFETQSPAMPTVFDLYMDGETCLAVRQGSEDKIVLDGVACRPHR
ncbi:MAG: hypothetical protein AAF437_15165 [Pseudomonadota bacterium]